MDNTHIQIRYDKDNILSAWMPLSDIQGVECNNPGVCEDDIRHQKLYSKWQETCTSNVFQACTTDDECKVSENCKGTCMGVVLPKHPQWFEAFENPPNCAKQMLIAKIQTYRTMVVSVYQDFVVMNHIMVLVNATAPLENYILEQVMTHMQMNHIIRNHQLVILPWI